MRKIIIILTLLLSSLLNSYGQWYEKKYQVSDINYLTEDQLNESLKQANEFTLASWLVAGVGGIMVIYGRNVLHDGLPDDATIVEELLGNRFMGHTYYVLGTGMAVSGTACGFFGLGRRSSIKTALRNKKTPSGSLNISPAVILNNYNQNYCTGLTITFNF